MTNQATPPAKRAEPHEWVWVIVDYHLRPEPNCMPWVSVEDGPDEVPTEENQPCVVFVPTVAGHPIGTTKHDPPIYWSGTVRDAFVAVFDQRFGDPRIVEGQSITGLGWCPLVVYELAQPVKLSRVGQVLDWCDVESGMLVRSVPETGFVWHYVRHDEHGTCVGCSSERSRSWGFMAGSQLPLWKTWGASGTDGKLPRVTVIAEGITGTETGAQLRALSEAYDARLT